MNKEEILLCYVTKYAIIINFIYILLHLWYNGCIFILKREDSPKGDIITMEICIATLNQIAFLFGFIIIGYILVKTKVLTENSAAVLSKLENNVFIPGLIIGTFIKDFTPERIAAASTLLVEGLIVGIGGIVFAIIASKLLTKDKYVRNIYTYGLSFSNFGFMGNAVVMSMFPDIFFEYLIFTLPAWICIYVWGVPVLLIADSQKKPTFKEAIKNLFNPMFISLLIGIALCVLRISLPGWLVSLVDTAKSCMSPIAMILTGIVVSCISLKKTFTNVKIYLVSILRLIVMPGIFIFVASFFELSQTTYICALCLLSMPLGLNTIVIPSSLGRDTTIAAGLAVISHLLAAISIPLIFTFIK